MTKPWNMARTASRQELPKQRKMHGPVGYSYGPEGVPPGVRYDACRHCGFHVCNCYSFAEPKAQTVIVNGVTITEDQLNASLREDAERMQKHLRDHAELVYQTISESRVFKQFEPEQPAVGTWEWAKAQMKQGHVVNRPCWVNRQTFLRMSSDGSGYESKGSLSVNAEWLRTMIKDEEFSTVTDWQLADVDQPASWEWAKAQMQQGRVVAREVWDHTLLRMSGVVIEMSSDFLSQKTLVGRDWVPRNHIEDVFAQWTDWQLVDVDPR